MKNYVFIVLIFLSNSFLFSYTSYYWVNGKKEYISVDKTSISIYYNKNKKTEIKKEFDPNIKKISNNDIDNIIVVDFFKPIDILKSKYKDLNVKDVSYAFKDTSGNKQWLSNKIICKPKFSNNLDIDKLLKRKMIKIINKTNLDVLTLEVKNIKDVIRISNELYETNLFEWCHPDFLIEVQRTSLPWEKQYYVNNKTHFSVNAFDAWEYETGSENIVVAVIDDGVENHVDLCSSDGSTRVLNGYTPSGITSNGRPGPGEFHGQACAGIIAASHSSNIKGIAPKVKILPVKIRFGYGIPSSEYANAINWAWQNGADVLSNSWGGGRLYDNIRNAIENAKSLGRNGKGSIVVFSSGNNGLNNVDAKAQISIAVGAINKSGLPALKNGKRYTNIGKNQDLVAFGGDAYNGIGDIRTIDREGNEGYNNTAYTDHFSGTSAACPQVSGAAALILSINPNLSREQVENILFSTAIDMGLPGRDNTYGHGRLNIFSAIIETYKTIDNNYIFNEGKLNLTKVEENKKWIVHTEEHIVDIYKASKTLEYIPNKVHYMGSGSFKSNPYNNNYWVNITNSSDKTIIETYFIHLKSSNIFLPQNPNDEWATTYLTSVPKILISDKTIGNNEEKVFTATKKIILKPGFHAQKGSKVKTNLINYP